MGTFARLKITPKTEIRIVPNQGVNQNESLRRFFGIKIAVKPYPTKNKIAIVLFESKIISIITVFLPKKHE